MILGRGVKLVFPCVAFHIGDDPSQKMFTGCYDSSALRSCIFCDYRPSVGVFDVTRDLPKDSVKIYKACAIAEVYNIGHKAKTAM